MSPAPVSSLHRDLRFRLEAAARSREGPAWLLEGLVEEFAFLRWRFDFAWPREAVAVECDGGHWGVRIHTGKHAGRVVPSRHVGGKGYVEGCRKLNAAALDGWIVLRYTREMLAGLAAVREIATALRDRRAAREEAPHASA